LFFVVCYMSLDFVIGNMCETCAYVHFRVEAFVKICAKSI
jgi:hypothetical protein